MHRKAADLYFRRKICGLHQAAVSQRTIVDWKSWTVAEIIGCWPPTDELHVHARKVFEISRERPHVLAFDQAFSFDVDRALRNHIFLGRSRPRSAGRESGCSALPWFYQGFELGRPPTSISNGLFFENMRDPLDMGDHNIKPCSQQQRSSTWMKIEQRKWKQKGVRSQAKALKGEKICVKN